jgi:hypothetical protein
MIKLVLNQIIYLFILIQRDTHTYIYIYIYIYIYFMNKLFVLMKSG